MLGASTEKGSRTMRNGYQVGDMVWGKVKYHPWWPGLVFDEAVASSVVFKEKREGCLLVAFFGDASYGWFDPGELLPFALHYSEKLMQTNAQTFLTAVEEALDETRRRAALGLACCCRSPSNFRPVNAEGFFEVDVPGYEAGGLYSMEQIQKARENFQPRKMLSFIRQLALRSRTDVKRSISLTTKVAKVLAYRKATFEEFDETYAQAFGVQPVRRADSAVAPDDCEKASSSGKSMTGEAPSESKYPTKHVNVEDLQKEDNNHSTPRNGPKNTKSGHLSKGAGDHISKKSALLVAMKPEVRGNHNSSVDLSPCATGKEPVPGKNKNQNADVVTRRDGADKTSNVRKDPGQCLNSKKPDTGELKRKKSLSVGGQEERCNCLETTRKIATSKSPKVTSVLRFLLALARDTFYRAEKSIADNIKRFILQFQSFADGQSSEDELIGAIPVPFGTPPKEIVEDIGSDSKPFKKRVKAGSLLQAGESCGTSNRQEEISIKSVEGCAEMKSLATERRNGGGDKKRTMLVVTFPPGTRLPSVSELKARFARFGPLDVLAIRQLWKSSKCEVVFMNRADANAAYAHAIRNRTFLANTKASYWLQDLEDSSSKLPKSGNPNHQLEPCPKELEDDSLQYTKNAKSETAPLGLASGMNGSGRGGKSLLCRSEAEMSTTGNNPNGYASSSSTTFNGSSQSFQHVVPSTLPPRPLVYSPISSVHGVRSSVDAINLEYPQNEAKKSHHYQTAAANVTTNGVDISSPMLHLLARCSQIVADLKHSRK
ncbi:hypothetical protein RJ640_014856 [Escallonia rubra]|uniref:PWWP domain-containing protein n=1 Tax=Escallonia rubra TaxID=112253 RepID=A0AA88UNG6_9ASTE|nr:hypothetical protein RJ640_014856 [Escallonia rubra]